MDIAAFDFDLPPDRIAQHPATPRDAARLLDLRAGLSDTAVSALPDLLAPGDLLVMNDTRVIPAQLAGYRGDVPVSVTLHRQAGPDRWRAFARPARRLRPGDRVAFAPDFAATVVSRDGGEVLLAFDCGGEALTHAIDRHGRMPLPPYIKRADAGAADTESYQTVYARESGAVAAPTAGLHFTPALLDRLRARGIGTAMLTLHVGAGTFLPVTEADVTRHRMHAEWGRLPQAVADAVVRTRAAGGRVVAVGTTSLRLLEAAAAAQGGTLTAAFEGETDLFILPGYRFAAVDLLLTNFHLPRSTLFMLVCAFAGSERVRAAYDHAIRVGYRFYSYGDCCLMRREP